MSGSSNLIFFGVGHLGQLFIVDESYRNILNVSDRSGSQERRRLKDQLSDDRKAQDLLPS